MQNFTFIYQISTTNAKIWQLMCFYSISLKFLHHLLDYRDQNRVLESENQVRTFLQRKIATKLNFTKKFNLPEILLIDSSFRLSQSSLDQTLIKFRLFLAFSVIFGQLRVANGLSTLQGVTWLFISNLVSNWIFFPYFILGRNVPCIILKKISSALQKDSSKFENSCKHFLLITNV